MRTYGTGHCTMRRRTELKRLEQQNSRSAAGEWFEVVSLGSVLTTAHAARASISVRLFTPELPLNHQQFYNKKFFPESGMGKKRVDDQDSIYWDAVESVKKERY